MRHPTCAGTSLDGATPAMQCWRETEDCHGCAGLDRCDGILYTHNHADHTFGLDEVRRFNALMRAPIDVYADERTMLALRRVYQHIFDRDGNVNDSFVATNRLLQAGESVTWLQEPVTAHGVEWPAGTLFIPNQDSTPPMLRQLAQDLGLHFVVVNIDCDFISTCAYSLNRMTMTSICPSLSCRRSRLTSARSE